MKDPFHVQFGFPSISTGGRIVVTFISAKVFGEPTPSHGLLADEQELVLQVVRWRQYPSR